MYIIIVYAYVYMLHLTESATIHNTTILLAYLSTCDGWYLIHPLMLCLQQDMTWITKDCSVSDSIDSKIIPLKSMSTNILTVTLSCTCISHVSVFLPARRYASAGNSDRNVSVCLSRAGIMQNEES